MTSTKQERRRRSFDLPPAVFEALDDYANTTAKPGQRPNVNQAVIDLVLGGYNDWLNQQEYKEMMLSGQLDQLPW